MFPFKLKRVIEKVISEKQVEKDWISIKHLEPFKGLGAI